MFVFVTNRNDFTHTDRYNGRDFTFPAGEKQMIPVEAAEHMFGFNRLDKTENLVRLGWANEPENAGVKRLARFVFTDAKIVEDDASEATVQEAGASISLDTPIVRRPGRPPTMHPKPGSATT